MRGDLVILTRVLYCSHCHCPQHTDREITAGILVQLTQDSWHTAGWSPALGPELGPSTCWAEPWLRGTTSLRPLLLILTLMVIMEAARKASCLAQTQPLLALLCTASDGKSEAPVVTHRVPLLLAADANHRMSWLAKGRNPRPLSAWRHHRAPVNATLASLGTHSPLVLRSSAQSCRISATTCVLCFPEVCHLT